MSFRFELEFCWVLFLTVLPFLSPSPPTGIQEIGEEMCRFIQSAHWLLSNRGVFSPRIMSFLEVMNDVKQKKPPACLRPWVQRFCFEESQNNKLRDKISWTAAAHWLVNLIRCRFLPISVYILFLVEYGNH